MLCLCGGGPPAGVLLSVVDYAETFKVNGPTESCVEPELSPAPSCEAQVPPQSEPVRTCHRPGQTFQYVMFFFRLFVRTSSPVMHSAAVRTSWMSGPSLKPACWTCATLKTPQTWSCVKPSQSSPDSVSMQEEAPQHGGTKPSAVRTSGRLQHRRVVTNVGSDIVLIEIKRFSQIRRVRPTWSSWSAAVLVLTAAPTLRPVGRVISTAMMAAAALQVTLTCWTSC